MSRSNYEISLASLKEATSLFPQFVKVFAKELIFLFLLQLFLDQSVESLSGKFKSGADQSMALIGLILVLSMISEFFLNNAYLLLAARIFRSQKPGSSIQLQLEDLLDYKQMVIEEIRFFGEVLMGFILFIFPGFNRLVEYSWVPFVVLFDEDYRKGKVDALKASKFMARRHFWYLSTVLTLTSLSVFVSDYLITGGEGSIFVNHLPVFLAAVIAILLNLYFKLFYCALYRFSRERAYSSTT